MEKDKQPTQNQTIKAQNQQVKPVAVEKMAVKFPDWDLLPPALLIKRGKNES